MEDLDATGRGEGSEDHDRKLVLLLTNVMLSGGILEFDLPSRGEFTLGREPTADVRVDSPSVSRAHARFSVHGDRLTVRDLGSRNGTHVNGQRIRDEPVEIRPDDALRFGDVLGQLRFVRVSRALVRRALEPVDFDTRLEEEAERCVRYDRSLAVIAIELLDADAETVARARQAVLSNLRTLDAATWRSGTRIDVLAAECDANEALAMANRIAASLRNRTIAASVGIAAYPGDVPSAQSLLVAATMAMREAADGQVGQARAGARMIQLGALEIVVAEPAMVRMFGLIERVSNTNLPVLVSGETGSGKEIVAEAIHHWGPRANHPLVRLNCAAVPENLLESELFGHERGAFSGADRAKPGLFEEADGGTLFLDEIGDMSLLLQAKLLRVLEDQRVRPVGATKHKHVDVRIIAATHHDLRQAVTDGRFREDLFYRLSTVVLRVPPLRERPREIPLLAEKFIADACVQAKREPVTIGADTMQLLIAHAWPGNVRELRNVMSATVMMCEGTEIRPQHLPPQVAAAVPDDPTPPQAPRRRATVPAPRPAATLEDEIRAFERERILSALETCDGNQTRAAEYLGMPRRTLVSKLATFQIDRPRKKLERSGKKGRSTRSRKE